MAEAVFVSFFTVSASFPHLSILKSSKEVTHVKPTHFRREVKTHLLESGALYKLVAVLPYRCYIPYLFIYSLFISLDDNLNCTIAQIVLSLARGNSLLAPV